MRGRRTAMRDDSPYAIGSIDEEWATTTNGPKYDRKKVYRRSTDGHGHGEKLQVKMLETQIGMMQQWVNDRRTEYRSVADFVRDAVYHRLHDMTEQFPDETELSHHLKLELLMAEMETQELNGRRRDDVLKVAAGRMQREIEDGRWEQVQYIIDQLTDLRLDWPEAPSKRAEQIIEQGRAALRRAVGG